MADLEQIIELRDSGALFVINHSGGKDSQAMTQVVRDLVPADQVLVVHAHLPEVVWEDAWDHIKDTCAGLSLLQTTATKTFFQMVERRGMWPSPKYRQCTSDLKRGPIEKAVRHYLRDHPQFNGMVVNCIGLRAEESANRAKASPFKFCMRNSKAGRQWWEWLPIHDWEEDHVWAAIENAGQKPHWVYAEGMSRFSCCFCIFSSKRDLRTGARLRPILYRRYVETEKRLDHTINMEGRGLEEITGILASKCSPDTKTNERQHHEA